MCLYLKTHQELQALMVMMVVIVAITTPYYYLRTPLNNDIEVEEKRKEG
jgi:hypothetical protein